MKEVKMSGSSSGDGLSRLCVVIDDCLRPYNGWENTALTKGNEKDLLISLSQVLREIQRWIYEFDRDSTDDVNECDEEDGCVNSHSEDHQCLTMIVADLVGLLAVKSQYVQHLAGNILVVISEFIVTTGSSWDKFIGLLCVCFELALSNSLSYFSASSVSVAEKLNCDPSDVIILQLRLKSANWGTAAGIIRILRCIMKCLKEETEGGLVEALMNSLSSCLSYLPWNLLDKIHVLGDIKDHTHSCDDTSFSMGAGETEQRIVFLGYLLQLFCSLVEVSGLGEEAGNSQNKPLILHTILNLVPDILKSCLGEGYNWSYTRMLPYFRHKTLMLMIRLSSRVHLDHLTLLLWLQLLHEYFQDLLLEPISRPEPTQNDCLEGSPFLLSLSDLEMQYLSFHHLQGQAVFVFLRCSLSLIGLREASESRCKCRMPNSSLISDIDKIEDCCASRRGFLELCWWLRGHLPSNMFADQKMNVEECITFAASFIELFIHEDDMLFEVLLLLFGIPSSAEKQIFKEGSASQGAKDNMFFHVSNLFSPLLLFHVFLAELQYDHQVLLDCLISKDTGIRCAEYLLRCLRAVCDSWDLFLELSMEQKVVCQETYKRRKVFVESLNSYEESSSTSMQGGTALVECKNDHNPGSKCYRVRSLQFAKATTCLLSLKDALKKLHRRNLFPYNPDVLLRRLSRFQQLYNDCIKLPCT